MQKLFFYQFTVSDEEEDSNALQKPLKALFLQWKTVLLIENPMLRGHMSLFIFFGWLKRRFKGKVAPKSTLKMVPNLYKCLFFLLYTKRKTKQISGPIDYHSIVFLW